MNGPTQLAAAGERVPSRGPHPLSPPTAPRQPFPPPSPVFPYPPRAHPVPPPLPPNATPHPNPPSSSLPPAAPRLVARRTCRGGTRLPAPHQTSDARGQNAVAAREPGARIGEAGRGGPAALPSRTLAPWPSVPGPRRARPPGCSGAAFGRAGGGGSPGGEPARGRPELRKVGPGEAAGSGAGIGRGRSRGDRRADPEGRRRSPEPGRLLRPGSRSPGGRLVRMSVCL